jgi:hypothetical protein
LEVLAFACPAYLLFSQKSKRPVVAMTQLKSSSLVMLGSAIDSQ